MSGIAANVVAQGMRDEERFESILNNFINGNRVILNHSEVKDFGLDGDEDEQTIKGYADDYLSDIATEKAEHAASAQERYDEQHEQDVFNTEAGQHVGRGYSEEGLVRQWAKSEGIQDGIIE